MTPSGTRSRPRPATSGPPDPQGGDRPLRVGILAPISWRVPPRHYGPWEQFVSLLTEGLVARGVDVTLFATADSVTSARLVAVAPDRLLGGPVAGCQGLGGTAHRGGVRAGRRRRPAAQQLRLPPTDLQPAGRHPGGDHDPRLRVGRHPAGLPRPRRPHLLRRHQRRRPPSAAAVRGHDPPRDRPRRLRPRGRTGPPPGLLRPDPSGQGDRGRDRGGRACGTAPGHRGDRAGPGLLRHLRRPARRRRPGQLPRARRPRGPAGGPRRGAGAAAPDRLRRALRVQRGRGDGVRHAGDRVPARVDARARGAGRERLRSSTPSRTRSPPSGR